MGRMTDVRGEQISRTLTDPQVMRAMSHPARLEIMEYLNSTGASVTATECAEIVGMSPSATSYHLRELAKVGLVEQAPSRGDGRERVWQSPIHSYNVPMSADADPEARAAEDTLIEVYLTRDFERIRGHLAKARDEPAEWRDGSALMGSNLLVTAEELKAFTTAVQDLVEPLKRRNRIADPPEGARTVIVHFAAFPE
jgi:DNA-binding transcriptional ArsR family regulator